MPTDALVLFQPWSRLYGLILRLGVGIIFIDNGWPKLTREPVNVAGFMTQLNVPLPEITTWVVTILELGGGILLILGVFTRVIALLMAVEMALITFVVKADTGLVAQQGVGWELELALGVAALALTLIGPGLLALDSMVGVEPKAVVPRRA